MITLPSSRLRRNLYLCFVVYQLSFCEIVSTGFDNDGIEHDMVETVTVFVFEMVL